MKILNYTYKNGLGHAKTLTVYIKTNENGKFPIEIWDNKTGENCGSGECTKDQIVAFLNNYEIIPNELLTL